MRAGATVAIQRSLWKGEPVTRRGSRCVTGLGALRGLDVDPVIFVRQMAPYSPMDVKSGHLAPYMHIPYSRVAARRRPDPIRGA